jgi:hypothetical protein
MKKMLRCCILPFNRQNRKITIKSSWKTAQIVRKFKEKPLKEFFGGSPLPTFFPSFSIDVSLEGGIFWFFKILYLLWDRTQDRGKDGLVGGLVWLSGVWRGKV